MEALLMERASQMGILITPAQAAQFSRYHDMLLRANRQMNLTRVSEDPGEAIDRNYLDSITPLASGLLSGCGKIADVGSGAGFPGIPLAILLPDAEITLIDALDKRVQFLTEVIDALHLHARAVHFRAEEAGRRPELREQFDAATSRAVASLNVLCELTLPLLRVGGSMIAYKGPAWQEELDGAQNALKKLGASFSCAVDAPIPGRDWNHVLLKIQKDAPTASQYPRRPGMPEKKPL